MEEEILMNHVFTDLKNLAHQFDQFDQAEAEAEAEAAEATADFLPGIGTIVISETGQVLLAPEVALGEVL
jgi:hypothetical protein